MKKKLMAMLVAAAMLVCMMPAMAFADEAPAEEQTVQAAEEVVVPEAAEEDAVAPETEGAVLEDEAVVEEAELEKESIGSWNGWVLTYNGTAEKAANAQVQMNGKTIDFKIKVGTNDFSGIVDNYIDAKGRVVVAVLFSDAHFLQQAYVANVKVAVDKASSTDTIFTYAVDSYVVDNPYSDSPEDRPFAEGNWFSVKEPSEVSLMKNYDFFGNTITLKAGETTASNYLYFGVPEGKSLGYVEEDIVVGIVIKETGNTGNYATDTSLWVWTPYSMTKEAGQYAKFANRAEIQALLDKVNYSEMEEAEKLLVERFQYDEMTFTHTVEAKGVQTGDSNSLGLWVVVMAVAGVAAAAVALKRREN